MGRRHPNHRLVKIHRSYVVEEIACLFGVHKNTVREWIKAGLPTSDKRRPMLILGHHLADFLRRRRQKNKQPCRHGEIYCVRCRAPKPPGGGMAEYRPVTETSGNLTAICPDCNSIMNRRINIGKLEQFFGKADVALPQALRQVSKRIESCVNSDFKQETQ
jgi:hypothetical protein